MDKLGFRINKYFKISVMISVIDILIFYILEKLGIDINIFYLILSKWSYISLFIVSILIIIYFVDILFFYNRNYKYKILFIFKESFKNWRNYIRKDITIKDEDKKLDFYYDIYNNVKNEEKIKGIMEDEILIRDVVVHFIITNQIIVIFFLVLQSYKFIIYLYFFGICFIIYLLLNIAYINYLEYFITEIYISFNCNKNKK